MSNEEITPEEAGSRARDLVAALGRHSASELGLDLLEGDDDVLWRWLLLCTLMGSRVEEARARALAQDLLEKGTDSPARLVATAPETILETLATHDWPRPEATAALLLRLNRGLLEHARGSIASLAEDADDLETLGGRMARLGSGFGRASVLRFLRPLRERFSAAGEIPISPAARAAALHLGVLREGEDEEGAPSALRKRTASGTDMGAPAWIDIEAALERLGARSCLRERARRCPLPSLCPLLDESRSA